MFRRMGWELRDRCERGEESPDKAERERYVQDRAPHWNYMVDKGWLHAIEHFAQFVLDGKPPRTATPNDAWRASVLAHATIRSRESGTVVRL